MANKKPDSLVSWIMHWLGSLQLAVGLLLTLASVLAIATFLESAHGRAFAQWYVYQSSWFKLLLCLLGVNILFAALNRFPWKRQQTGFVITHGGLLVLLAGSIQTLGGVDGSVTVEEGKTASRFTLGQHSQITARWANQPSEAPYYYSFEAGPSDWREGTRLDLGEVDGVRVRVLHYFARASAREDWVADATGASGPAVRFKLVDPSSSEKGDEGEERLMAEGDEGVVNGVRLQLRQASSQAMVDDFLKPPTDKLGKNGLLLAYYKDRVKHIAVDENVGKKVILDDSGLAVEIVEYHANAIAGPGVRFRSAGETPKNPLLELRVHEKDKQSMRQLAFAKKPLMNLDGQSRRVCPVKFCFLHPADLGPALELLQTGDGRLLARTLADRKVNSTLTPTPLPEGEGVGVREVKAGDTITLPGNLAFTVVEHLPHARQMIVFESETATSKEKDASEAAAAQIEITAGGVTQTVWLQRNHPSLGSNIIVTPHGPLRVSFGHADAALGFSLKLVEFRKGVNPGGVGNAAFASVVRLIDKGRGVDKEYVISMNEPLTYNGLTFYQSAFNDEEEHGARTSTFSIGRDPGRWLKYAGCLLLCLGAAIMFYMRAYFFKRAKPALRASPGQRGSGAGEEPVVLKRVHVPSEEETSIQAFEPSPAPEIISTGPN